MAMTQKNGQHQEPAGEGLPHRQGEKVDREDARRWGRRDRRRVGLEPVKSEFRPIGHHGGCRGQGDENGAGQRANVQHAFNRQTESPCADHEGGGAAQVRPAEAHQDPEPAVD